MYYHKYSYRLISLLYSILLVTSCNKIDLRNFSDSKSYNPSFIPEEFTGGNGVMGPLKLSFKGQSSIPEKIYIRTYWNDEYTLKIKFLNHKILFYDSVTNKLAFTAILNSHGHVTNTLANTIYGNDSIPDFQYNLKFNYIKGKISSISYEGINTNWRYKYDNQGNCLEMTRYNGDELNDITKYEYDYQLKPRNQYYDRLENYEEQIRVLEFLNLIPGSNPKNQLSKIYYTQYDNLEFDDIITLKNVKYDNFNNLVSFNYSITDIKGIETMELAPTHIKWRKIK